MVIITCGVQPQHEIPRFDSLQSQSARFYKCIDGLPKYSKSFYDSRGLIFFIQCSIKFWPSFELPLSSFYGASRKYSDNQYFYDILYIKVQWSWLTVWHLQYVQDLFIYLFFFKVENNRCDIHLLVNRREPPLASILQILSFFFFTGILFIQEWTSFIHPLVGKPKKKTHTQKQTSKTRF